MLYYNSKQLSSSYEFGKQLLEKICRQRSTNQPLIFLCIGSDRATGEAFMLWCAQFAQDNNMNITMTVSDDPACASDAVKAYLI